MLITDDRPSSYLDHSDVPPSLAFDRRIGPRRPAEGKLLAAVPAAASGVRLTQLELIDAGEAGIGAIGSSAVEPGSSISLYPVGAAVARDHGVVARCDEQPDGSFLIGIAFDARMAA